MISAPLSVKVIGSVIEAWKVGKIGLSLLTIGTITILAAFGLAMRGRETGSMALIFLGVGTLLIGSVGALFIYEAVLPAYRATKLLRSHAALLDAVQDAAIQLTEIITEINDFALINASAIVSNIEQAKSLIILIPGSARLLETEYFTKSDAFVRKIKEVAHQSRDLVIDVRDSLSKADVARLAIHVRRLSVARASIQAELQH